MTRYAFNEPAQRIKALRELVTVAAAPERAVRNAVRAERPVTARIRERRVEPKVEAVHEPVAEVIALPVAKPVAVPAMYWEWGYARQVARRWRQDDGPQLRLF